MIARIAVDEHSPPSAVLTWLEKRRARHEADRLAPHVPIASQNQPQSANDTPSWVLEHHAEQKRRRRRLAVERKQKRENALLQYVQSALL